MAQFNGTIKRMIWAQGSKSEHKAIVLVTHDSTFFRLRLKDGNPFEYKDFEQFVGKKVSVAGDLVPGQTLVVNSVNDIKPAATPGVKPPQP